MSNTTKLSTGALAVAAGLILCGPSVAQDRGSQEDQLACTPDVYRLCSSYVPDEDAIVACLRKNMHALSPACHTVMSRPAAPAARNSDDDPD